MKRKYTKAGWEKILEVARDNNSKKKIKSIEEYTLNPNYCLACGEVIPLKDNVYTTRRKMFCNHRCAAHYSNKTRVVIRKCLQCDKVLVSSQRDYCSWGCRIKSNFESQRDRWMSGEISGGYDTGLLKDFAKKHLIDTRGEKCEECGWNKLNAHTNKVPLTFHHIDGNSLNHKPDNIKILCPNCHSLTETYGGANRGSGRKNRKR